MNKNLNDNENLLEDFTDLTNRKKNQEIFLFDLLKGDFDKLVALEEKLHRNNLSYCSGDLDECEKVLSMEFKYQTLGLKNFEYFKNL